MLKPWGLMLEMVIAMVPGIGPVVSGAISAGLALAEGQPITDVLEAGIAGAIPGGAIAKAAFDMGKEIVKDKGVKNISALGGDLMSGVAAAANITIPPAIKAAITTGLSITQSVANGERIDHAVMDNASNLINTGLSQLGLPAAATAGIRAGLMTGVGVAQGKKLQNAIAGQITSPGFISAIGGAGLQAINASAVLKAASNIVPSGGSGGFNLGIGAVGHAMGIHQFTTLRSHLSPADMKGFDMAVSMHIGRVTQAPTGSPKQQAGHFLMHGMSGADPMQKQMMLQAVATDPEIKAGAVAASQVIVRQQHWSWWQKLLHWLHLMK